jgi:hypothetical protein
MENSIFIELRQNQVMILVPEQKPLPLTNGPTAVTPLHSRYTPTGTYVLVSVSVGEWLLIIAAINL